MRIRVFSGTGWSGADHVGDFEFDAIPLAGHKLAIAGDRLWEVGEVKAIVHRISGDDEAADVALLLGPTSVSDIGADPLPFAELDGSAAVVPPPSASVPRSGPWGR